MLKKLLKYDFRSMLKTFIPLWLAFIGVAIANKVFLSINNGLSLADNDKTVFADITGSMLMTLFVTIVVASNVICFVLMIQRFYNGLLKDEGYLMFTLPAKPWQLITSKGISATVLFMANTLITLFGVFILVADTSFFSGLARFITKMHELPISWGVVIPLLMVLLIVAVLAGIFYIYAALALGHLATKHRVGWAIGAYIGINMVLSILATFATSILFRFDFPQWLNNMLSRLTPNSTTIGVILCLIVGCLILLAVFYIITERILSKKLNLE